jgi:CheY-like chemotaxis protein
MAEELAMYVLLVEDERRLSQVVRRVLEEEGHTVDAAYDGEEGLGMALEGSHDVIVLDVMLPEIDGMEVCRSLRKQKVDTPVLLLTALDSVDDKVRGWTPAPTTTARNRSPSRSCWPDTCAGRRKVQETRGLELTVEDLMLDMRRRRAQRSGKNID